MAIIRRAFGALGGKKHTPSPAVRWERGPGGEGTEQPSPKDTQTMPKIVWFLCRLCLFVAIQPIPQA